MYHNLNSRRKVKRRKLWFYSYNYNSDWLHNNYDYASVITQFTLPEYNSKKVNRLPGVLIGTHTAEKYWRPIFFQIKPMKSLKS